MIEVRKLTEEGITKFKAWLVSPDGKTPPPTLLNGDIESELFGNFLIDPNKKFHTRFDLGAYLCKLFQDEDLNVLLGADNDGLWAWIAVLYFEQLAGKKIRRSEHYIVTRQGSAGSLAYRHSVRTPFELVRVHDDGACVCLGVPIHTLGDMTEQLASRQTLSRHKGFFQTAHSLYIRDGKMRRGASSKPKKPKERKPGDRTGFGSIRRLAVALQRLNLTFDTEVMSSPQLVELLPKEFSKWGGSA